FHVQVESIIVPGINGDSSRMRSVIMDISQRVELEKNLALEQEKLSITLDSIADSIISTDTSGNIILFNRSAEKIFGVRESEVLGKNITDYVTFFEKDGSSVLNDIVDSILREEAGKKNYRSIIIYDRNGSERTVNLSGCIVRDKYSHSSGVVFA